MSEELLECVCGRSIRSAREYKLVFAGDEVRILCPNPSCPLRELGVARSARQGDSPKPPEVHFHPPYITWNTARLGEEKALRLIRQHMEDIVRLALKRAT